LQACATGAGLAAPIYAGIYKQAKKHAAGRHAKQGIAFTLSLPRFNALLERCQNRCELTQQAFAETETNREFQRPPSLPKRIVTVSINMALGTWGSEVLLQNALALIKLTHPVCPKTAGEASAAKDARPASSSLYRVSVGKPAYLKSSSTPVRGRVPEISL
jgi:hypothetical protein